MNLCEFPILIFWVAWLPRAAAFRPWNWVASSPEKDHRCSWCSGHMVQGAHRQWGIRSKLCHPFQWRRKSWWNPGEVIHQNEQSWKLKMISGFHRNILGCARGKLVLSFHGWPHVVTIGVRHDPDMTCWLRSRLRRGNLSIPAVSRDIVHGDGPCRGSRWWVCCPCGESIFLIGIWALNKIVQSFCMFLLHGGEFANPG